MIAYLPIQEGQVADRGESSDDQKSSLVHFRVHFPQCFGLWANGSWEGREMSQGEKPLAQEMQGVFASPADSKE